MSFIGALTFSLHVLLVALHSADAAKHYVITNSKTIDLSWRVAEVILYSDKRCTDDVTEFMTVTALAEAEGTSVSSVVDNDCATIWQNTPDVAWPPSTARIFVDGPSAVLCVKLVQPDPADPDHSTDSFQLFQTDGTKELLNTNGWSQDFEDFETSSCATFRASGPVTNTASGSYIISGTDCASIDESTCVNVIEELYSVSDVACDCEDVQSSSSRRLLAIDAIFIYSFGVSSSVTAATLVITEADLATALANAGVPSSLAVTISVPTDIEGSVASNPGGSLVTARVACEAPLNPMVPTGSSLVCAIEVTNGVKTDLTSFAGIRSTGGAVVSPLTVITEGPNAGLTFPFTVRVPGNTFNIWGEWSDGTDFTQGRKTFTVYDEANIFSTVSCLGVASLSNTVAAGETVTCTITPRDEKDGPVLNTITEQFSAAVLTRPAVTSTVTAFTGTSPGSSFTFDFTAPDAGVTTRIAVRLSADYFLPVVAVITMGQIAAVSITEGPHQPAGGPNVFPIAVRFTVDNDLAAGSEVHIGLPNGFAYDSLAGKPTVSAPGTWDVTTLSGGNDVVLRRSALGLGDEASVAGTALTVAFPIGSISAPSVVGPTTPLTVATYQDGGLVLDAVSAGVSGPTVVAAADVLATTAAATATGECNLTVAITVPAGEEVRTGDTLTYTFERIALVGSGRRRRLTSALTIVVVASGNFPAGSTITNMWRMQYQSVTPVPRMTVQVTSSGGAVIMSSSTITLDLPPLPFDAALVSDPYLWDSTRRLWVPFFPPVNTLVELFETGAFRVQGGFAQAEKSDCQCLWTNPDQTMPPTPGVRMVVTIIKVGSIEFHITLGGMYYREDGRWAEVTDGSWPEAVGSIPGVVVNSEDYADGHLSNSLGSFSWAALSHDTVTAADADWMPRQMDFPWGTHEYTHAFQAKIGAVSLKIMRGRSDGLEMLDVYVTGAGGSHRTKGRLGNPKGSRVVLP